MANKGRGIELGLTPEQRAVIIEHLTNTYGLDIICTFRGDKRNGTVSRHALVGQWFGKVYIDYTQPG